MLFVYGQSYAEILVGEGCSRSKDEALKFALSDLSSQIYVNVESRLTMSSVQSSSFLREYMSHNVEITSDLPIVSYTKEYQNGCMRVAMDTIKALPVYMEHISRTVKDINTLVSRAKSADTESEEVLLYTDALKIYDEYNKLYIAASSLKAENIPSAQMSRKDVEAELIRLQAKSSDIRQIAANIKAQLPNAHYGAVSVALTDGTVTPFAMLLASQLYQNDSHNGNVLSCRYDKSGNPFLISCLLKDDGGRALYAAATNADRKVCLQADCVTPVFSYDYSALFPYEKSAVRGYFYSNYGVLPVILKGGDIVRLYLRINAASQVMLTGAGKDGATYIIPINNKLVFDIDVSMLNKQILLAPFKVVPPYGAEKVAVTAYKGNLMKLLADIQKDENGNYILDKNTIEKLNGEKNLIFHSELDIITME